MRIKKQFVKLAIILSSILLIISSLNNIIISEDSETVQNDVLDKNNENNNLIPPKSSGAWTLNYIDIDDSGGATHGTWAQCEANYDWCSFDGIYYVLEDITILPGYSGAGIRIANSIVPFRIEKCTILQREVGIRFASVSNGEIRNCNIEGESWWSEGIYLSDCDYIDINGNLINRAYYGIHISDLDNSFLTYNTIYSSKYSGIYSGSVENTDISFNQIVAQAWWGISLNLNNNCTFEKNLIADNDKGFSLSYTHNSLFKENFLIDNEEGFSYGWGYTPCENNTYINNVEMNEVENEDYKDKSKTISSYDPSFLYGVLIITSGFTTIIILKKSKVVGKKSGEI